jgi:hypothetical protein
VPVQQVPSGSGLCVAPYRVDDLLPSDGAILLQEQHSQYDLLLHGAKTNSGIAAPGPQGPQHFEAHEWIAEIAHPAPPAAQSNLDHFSQMPPNPPPGFCPGQARRDRAAGVSR